MARPQGVVEKLSIATGINLTDDHYTEWLESGGDLADEFDAAVRMVLPHDLYEEASQLARLEGVLIAVLNKESSATIGGIEFNLSEVYQ